jgi:hypothetical protein
MKRVPTRRHVALGTSQIEGRPTFLGHQRPGALPGRRRDETCA